MIRHRGRSEKGQEPTWRQFILLSPAASRPSVIHKRFIQSRSAMPPIYHLASCIKLGQDIVRISVIPLDLVDELTNARSISVRSRMIAFEQFIEPLKFVLVASSFEFPLNPKDQK